MLTDPTLTLADQIFWLVAVFMKTMAAEGCKRRIGLFSVAIWSRVRRFERRFLALYAEWKAGTLPQARGVRAAATPHPSPPPQGGREAGANGAGGAATTPHPDPPPQGGREKSGAEAAFDPGAHDAASFEWAKQRPASVLPRAFRWLQGMLPISAGTIASGLSSLIDNHPEMRAFVAEVPQIGRSMRPACGASATNARISGCSVSSGPSMLASVPALIGSIALQPRERPRQHARRPLLGPLERRRIVRPRIERRLRPGFLPPPCGRQGCAAPPAPFAPSPLCGEGRGEVSFARPPRLRQRPRLPLGIQRQKPPLEPLHPAPDRDREQSDPPLAGLRRHRLHEDSDEPEDLVGQGEAGVGEHGSFHQAVNI